MALFGEAARAFLFCSLALGSVLRLGDVSARGSLCRLRNKKKKKRKKSARTPLIALITHQLKVMCYFTQDATQGGWGRLLHHSDYTQICIIQVGSPSQLLPLRPTVAQVGASGEPTRPAGPQC